MFRLAKSVDPDFDLYATFGIIKNPDGSCTRLPSNVSENQESDDPSIPFRSRSMSVVPTAEFDHTTLGLIKNSDGSFTRLPSNIPATLASDNPSNPFNLSKDITINQSKNTWVRLLVPKKSFDSEPTSKLPIIVYFHGGGFVASSAATTLFYNLYNPITTEIPAIVISVEYRLAPEARLPAAYEDSMEVLHWIKNSNEEWLTKYGDVSNCFLLGSSAGGNVAYHVGLRAAQCTDGLKPLEIKGLIMHYPFFGGEKRTDSEIRLKDDTVLPLSLIDVAWELSLPIGADRDHEYSNPIKGLKRHVIEKIKRLKWKIIVAAYYDDPLIDRQIKFVKKLEKLGVSVMSIFDEGFHGSDMMDPSKNLVLINQMKEIIPATNSSSNENA